MHADWTATVTGIVVVRNATAVTTDSRRYLDHASKGSARAHRPPAQPGQVAVRCTASKSHARATAHSRLTVVGETSSASAVSTTESPAK